LEVQNNFIKIILKEKERHLSFLYFAQAQPVLICAHRAF
jgi:hypothetical protein